MCRDGGARETGTTVPYFVKEICDKAGDKVAMCYKEERWCKVTFATLLTAIYDVAKSLSKVIASWTAHTLL